MKLNVAVQMDPIARINIRGDSTFALLLEAQKRGHGLSYYTPDKLSLRGEELVAPVQVLTVRDEPGDHFTLGEPRREPLAAFDVILLRQDPPFDLAYITSTHFLERIHPKTLVVNNPASVRNAPEKIFVMDFPHLMPPTLISRDLDEINAFRDEHGAVVMKPLHGHGGAAVFRVMPQDMNFGSLFDMFSVTFREPWVIQRFFPRSSTATSASSWSTANSPAPSTACRRRTICAPTWCAAAPPKPPTSPRASAKSARRWAQRCASADCCSSASTSSTAISPKST